LACAIQQRFCRDTSLSLLMSMQKISASIQWPAPAPLEGIKSRTKPIFKMAAAEVDVGGKVLTVPSVTLALDSRIAAIGECGSAVAAVLLGDLAVSSGKVVPHPKLVVAHLGPHLAGVDAGVAQHIAAIVSALQERPQVVVLEEAMETGGEAWLRTFSEALRSKALSSFKGAVIVCVAEETFDVRRVCPERWTGASGKMCQENIPVGLEVVEDALNVGDGECESTGKAGKRRMQEAAANAEALLEQARELSEYCFEEDIVEKARAQNWTLSLLTETVSDVVSLRGFVVHRMIAAPRAELYIERLAVPRKFRGQGHAQQLMSWARAKAARMPQSECSLITCSAFDKVVPFYQKLGFVVCERPEGEEEEEMEDHQMFMKLSVVKAAKAV